MAMTALAPTPPRHSETSLVNGLRKARGLCEQKSLEPFRAYEEFPGVSATSDEQMGKQGDRMAVVDNELRVRGIRGVRVCDASIMPSLPGGQTASSTIAIAEKAAEMLQSRRAEQQAPAAAMATA
ncbi:GMC oxidoreductase-domain-containing protein [Pavlovales sp. CCMP2436]|nr:GMC oxidoreductase-domain-containing protein [Pavlovales sp. CCMP2436]